MNINEVLTQSKTNLNDLIKQSSAIQSRCADYDITNASDKNVHYNPDSLRFIYKPDTEDLRNVGATRHALSQFCNKIGVPTRYIEKCIDSGRLDLASDNINSWLEDFNKNLFIREYNDIDAEGNDNWKMRGVLSDRYSVLDTPEILDVLANSNTDKYQIKGYYLNQERFHLRMVQNKPMKVEGEDLYPGIQIDSSDVGRSILTAQVFIYRQVCTNGLVVPQAGGVLFQQKHVGISQKEFHSGFSASISNIPQIVENVTEIIGGAMKDNKYKRVFLDKTAMDNLVNTLKVKAKLSDEGVEKVINTMRDEYSPTRWGLVNAITQVARDYTLERRLELEAVAGNLLLVA